ncbi:MAG: alpha/beta fold hydrolase, partial [Acidimicrobiales bacterium]
MRSVDNMVAVGDDLALAVFDHGPVDARPLVLAHGMTWDHRHFAPLIAELVAEGHRVVTYDARGVGQSTRPVTDPAAHALAAQADDLAILLATLGGPQPVIGGVSAGAAISLEVARLGHPISGLVQIAPGVGPNGVAPETRDYLAWMTACVGKGGWPALQDGIAASDQPASAIADQLALAKVWESIFDVKSFVAMINGFPGSL